MENWRDKDSLNPRKTINGLNSKVLTREVYYAGKPIIEQGDDGGRAFYIEEGEVEVIVRDGPHELKVAQLGPGDIFGEMSLINHEPRSATVRCLTNTAVTIISRDEIEGKINRIDDEAIRALINVLSERLSTATRGQLDHYRNLAEFQDKIAGIVHRVSEGIDVKQRDKFRTEVEPLLDDLQKILDRYKAV